LLPWSKNSDKKVVAKLIRLPCPRDIKLGENIVPDLTTVFVKKRKRKMNYDWQEKKKMLKQFFSATKSNKFVKS